MRRIRPSKRKSSSGASSSAAAAAAAASSSSSSSQTKKTKRPQTSARLAARVVDLMHVWIEQLLYLRGVYPAHTFEETRVFDSVAWRSKSELVQEYVGEMVRALEPSLATGGKHHLVLVVVGAGERVERHVMEVSMTGDVQCAVHAGLGRGGASSSPSAAAAAAATACTCDDVGRTFREVLVRLKSLEARLPPLEAGVEHTFELFFYTDEFPEVMKGKWEETSKGSSSRPEGAVLKPLYSTSDLGLPLRVQLFSESGRQD